METKHVHKPDILIVGGGFGGLETALFLHRRLGGRVNLTLVSDRDEFLFRPHLIYVPFGFMPEQAKVDLHALMAAKNIRFIQAPVQSVDPASRRLRLNGETLSYDYLILATGARAAPSGVVGLEERAYAVWRESDLVLLRAAFDHLLRSAERKQPRRVVFLVPPESQWAGPLYEVAFLLARWLGHHGARATNALHFLTHEQTYMDVLGTGLHRPIAGAFKRNGIEAETGRIAKRVEEDEIVMADGRRIPFDLLIVSPTYRASVDWEGLSADDQGFLRTNRETGLVAGHERIYAVGDGSDYAVKQAFLALLQADAAAEHLAARLLEIRPTFAFEPSSLWVMDQYEQALFAQIPLDPGRPLDQPEQHIELISPGLHPRVLLREYLPWQAQTNNPLYAGLLWKGTQAGWGQLSHLMKP